MKLNKEKQNLLLTGKVGIDYTKEKDLDKLNEVSDDAFFGDADYYNIWDDEDVISGFNYKVENLPYYPISWFYEGEDMTEKYKTAYEYLKNIYEQTLEHGKFTLSVDHDITWNSLTELFKE